MTDIRFAVGTSRFANHSHQAFMPSVRLAYGGPPEAIRKGLSGEFDEQEPALLVSYYYYSAFKKQRSKLTFRDYALDSGAFSAHNSGKVIHLQEYIDFCGELLTNDKKLAEVYALDVIGDPVASARNCEEMNRQGIPAIPTFHLGSPWSMLVDMAKDYPKLALGGMVGKPTALKGRFIGQAFARVWPKKVHAFGVGSRRLLRKYPFHSADASNWEQGPTAYGRWQAYGNMSVRGGSQNLRGEVEWYLRLERELQGRWHKEMKLLGGQP